MLLLALSGRTEFWTRTSQSSEPRSTHPRARALPEGFTILIDTRERYPYRFAGRDVRGERMALPTGDYAVANAEATIAVLEPKTLENSGGEIARGLRAIVGRRSVRRSVGRMIRSPAA